MEVTRQQIFRLFVTLLLGVLVFLFPFPYDLGVYGITANPTALTLLIIFLSSFLLSGSLQRKRELNRSVLLELSRLRRLVHVIEGLSASKAWKNDFRKKTNVYMRSLSGKSLFLYRRSHDEFRDLTHTVYSFKPKTKHDFVLLDELLEVTRDLGVHRQTIESLLATSISPFILPAFLGSTCLPVTANRIFL